MQTIQVAKTLIIDEANNCLVLTRSNSHPFAANKPDLPGGQIDGLESPAQTIAREVFEETGLQIKAEDVRVLFATTTTEPERNLNFVRYVGVAYVPGTKPALKLSWEHSASEWIPLDEILQTLKHPEYTKGIRHIFKYHLLDNVKTDEA